MVSVGVKHHVYLLVRPEDCGSDLWKAADCEVVLVTRGQMGQVLTLIRLVCRPGD